MPASPWPDRAYAALLDEVEGRAGMVFEPARRPLVESAVERVRARLGVPTPEAFVDALGRSEAVWAEVLSALAVGETYFFREPAHFDLLRARILPERVEANGPDGRVRVWSAGCASGEEPYSVAILAEQMGLEDRVDVLASDVRGEALEQARAATYRPWSFRTVPDAARRTYFDLEGERFRLKDRLRARVLFFPFNLAAPAPGRLWFGLWGLDVVLCRNVLLYLSDAACAVVFRRLARALAPGGWLLLAASDPLPPPDVPLERVDAEGAVVFRRASPVVTPSTPAPVEARASSLVERAPVPRAEAVPTDAVDRIREVARRRGARAALAEAEAAAADRPLDPEVRYMQAMLHLDLGEPERASQSLRSVLYLDRTMPVAHFVLGLVSERLGRGEAAARSMKNARALLEGLDEDAPLRLADGETAGALCRAVERWLSERGGAG